MRLADSVLHRFVQIVQEGILSMTDVTDGLRMVEVIQSEDDPNVLVMSPEYKESYQKMQLALVKEGEALNRRAKGLETEDPS